MAAASFYFGIFKKIQVCAGIGTGYPHADAASSESLGFNVETSDANGFFAPLNHDNIVAPGGFSPALKPLVEQPDPNNPGPGNYLLAYPVLPSSDPQSTIPEANPLYEMFKASLTANGAIVNSVWYEPSVAIQGKPPFWPIMPMCAPNTLSDLIELWLEFNKPGPHTLLAAFHDWIVSGKPNDTPKGALNFTKPPQATMQESRLFVCSKIGDDGNRINPVGLDEFWNTSRIFLVHPSGPFIGGTTYPPTLAPGTEYNVVAQIGNSGRPAGRVSQQLDLTPVTVRADVFAFNTFMSTASVALPALSNLDVASVNNKYEEYVLRSGSYSVAGFRFDVDKVFNSLQTKLDAAFANDPDVFNGLTAKAWLANSHTCVKVRIAGDSKNPLPPDTDSPKANRRIAQRNFMMFDQAFFSQPPPPPAPWQNFIVEQPLTLFDKAKGRSTIRLTLQSTLPPEAFKLFLAVPASVYKRYFSAGKGMKGYTVVQERELAQEITRGQKKPFPDAIVLRATTLASTLEFTVNPRHRHIGMSLGIVYDPARHPTRPTGSVSMVHDAIRSRERAVTAVGGFTIEIVSNRGADGRTSA